MLANAASGTTSSVVGLAYSGIASGASGLIATDGECVASTAQWDAIAGTSGGLTFGVKYFLSATTAGNLTATPPSTAGQYVCNVGQALSSTRMLVRIQPRIQL
jgi:hypothetical protein